MKKIISFALSAFLILGSTVIFAEDSAADEVDKSGWMAVASSEIISAEKLIDSDLSTYWHSNYTAEGSTVTQKDTPPYTIEVTLDKAQTVSGIRAYPRSDGSTSGIVKSAELYLSADGKKYTKVGDIAYSEDVSNRAARETLFSGNVKVKAFKYVITEGTNGYGTMAELSLIKEKAELKATDIDKVELSEGEVKHQEAKKDVVETGSGKGEREDKPAVAEGATYEADEIVPTEDWKIHSTSALAGGNGPAAASDGDLSTFWHSYYESADGKITYKDNLPIDYTITFPQVTETSGFRYYPRAKEMSMSGIIKKAKAYASDDGVNFYLVTDEVEFLYGYESESKYLRTPVDVTFPTNIRAKAIRLSVTDSVSGYAVASEIRVLKPDSHHEETLTAKEFSDNSDKYMLTAVDKSGIKVTASSEQPYPFENQNDLDSTADKTIDGNINNTWHTQYRNDDGSTAGFNKQVMPAYLSYDFGKDYKISAVGYVPRGNGFIGTHWVEFSVSVSSDGVNYDNVGDYTLNETEYTAFGRTMIYLDEVISARYLKIDITATIDDGGNLASRHAAANEIDFYETVANKKERVENSGERYVLTVGSNVISVKKGQNFYEKTLDAAPFISSGTTLIPLRGLFEEMGASVSWDGESKKISVEADGVKMVFRAENTRVWVNDIRYSVTVGPRIFNSRTYIPLRFISERMGYSVSWDQATGSVTIEK